MARGEVRGRASPRIERLSIVSQGVRQACGATSACAACLASHDSYAAGVHWPSVTSIR